MPFLGRNNMSDKLEKCHIPKCLGHADERTAAADCSRCGMRRWVLVTPARAPEPTDYSCQRCRAVLAGRNSVDPLMTDAQRERLAQARQSPRARIFHRKEASIPTEDGS